MENSLKVCCMATNGERDPTDNAQAFYEWLQSGEADLPGIKYAESIVLLLKWARINHLVVNQLFGLGNKTYEHTND